jgi:5-methyltetrahydrofolate--homocysteine methyltransferase
MSLEFKPDFVEIRERMLAFWQDGDVDRMPLWVTAPRREPIPGPPAPPVPDDPFQLWTDQEYRIAAAESGMRQTWYGGEAVPCIQTQLGPGSLAVHLGARPVFMPTTVWYEPCIEDLSTGPDLAYDPQERWWVWTLEFVRKLRKRAAGRYIIAFPDLIENADTLASLRGSQELLMEMVEAPQAVHRYQRQILELYFRYYDELATLMNLPVNGSVFCSFSVWGPGRVCKLQCDMSCMISPQMFREFVQPYLRAQCQRLDHTLYHLDGPGATQHLPALLEIEELGGIQWTPGAGAPGVHDECWWPMYRQVQEAGKRLFLFGVPHHQVLRLRKEFDWRRMILSTYCPTQEEAEELLKQL